MFTGIIECEGELVSKEMEGSNAHLVIRSSISQELKIDQSISHNGVCLTVVALNEDTHTVTAIDETLKRTNLGTLHAGDKINLERCLKADGRLDGHIVQGHVDTTGICKNIRNEDGSWIFEFEHKKSLENTTVAKGSICVNGVSLTVVDSSPTTFTVAIIPYTYEHTNFRDLKPSSVVNLEFDILGKYVSAYLMRRGEL